MSLRLLLSGLFAGLCLAALPASAEAKGYLGVQIRLNPNGKGILIMEVLADSAAAKAGLKDKDIILKIDGTEPTSLKEFIGILDLKQPGDVVTLEIHRDGKEEKIKVTLGKVNG
jgi:S1-C subfamily serine protease